MSDIAQIDIRETRMEIQITDKAEKRIKIDDIEIGKGDDDRWLKVLASYVLGGELRFVVATPWVPDSGDAEGEQERWFIPATVHEDEVYASRFTKSKYVPD